MPRPLPGGRSTLGRQRVAQRRAEGPDVGEERRGGPFPLRPEEAGRHGRGQRGGGLQEGAPGAFGRAHGGTACLVGGRGPDILPAAPGGARRAAVPPPRRARLDHPRGRAAGGGQLAVAGRPRQGRAAGPTTPSPPRPPQGRSGGALPSTCTTANAASGSATSTPLVIDEERSYRVMVETRSSGVSDRRALGDAE